MNRDEVAALAQLAVETTKQRLHAALAERIAGEPDHTLQRLLERFESARGDD